MGTEVSSLAIYRSPLPEELADPTDAAHETIAAAAPLLENVLQRTGSIEQANRPQSVIEIFDSADIDPLVKGRAVKIARRHKLAYEQSMHRAYSYARAAAVYAAVFRHQSRLH